MRVAVLDLGTNSTRLLVAEVEDGDLEELERQTRVTRLGEGVDKSGRLTDDAIARVFDALKDFREAIDELGADEVVAVATSAVRDAENGEEFREQLGGRFGIDARTIPGEEEARLTFLGATAGRPHRETLVVDIGGGSTEFVIGHPGDEPEFYVSTKLGSVRHTERHLDTDPPPPRQVEALRADAHRIIEDAVAGSLREEVVEGIAVAGTATSLAAIDQDLDPYDPKRVHDYSLTLDAAERILDRLAALPLAERREVTGLHPDRAPTIVAGAGILVESMRAFGLDSITISEADILHGAALKTGEKGLDALGESD